MLTIFPGSGAGLTAVPAQRRVRCQAIWFPHHPLEVRRVHRSTFRPVSGRPAEFTRISIAPVVRSVAIHGASRTLRHRVSPRPAQRAPSSRRSDLPLKLIQRCCTFRQHRDCVPMRLSSSRCRVRCCQRWLSRRSDRAKTGWRLYFRPKPASGTAMIHWLRGARWFRPSQASAVFTDFGWLLASPGTAPTSSLIWPHALSTNFQDHKTSMFF